MSRPVRYLNLDDKPPCRKYPGKTVRELINDSEGIKWIEWMISQDGLMKTNCKLNGGETFEYYLEGMNKHGLLPTVK
jgi:hypothetical protein